MDRDDALHGLGIREPDVVEEAAAQEGVRKLLLVVAGDEDDRAVARLDQLLCLVDVELHAVQLAQQVVRELDVGLVDLVDQEHRAALALERPPQHAGHDVVGDVLDALVAELRIPQSRDGVVLVQAVLRLARRLDVPLEQRRIERARDFFGELRLARAGLALDEERARQRDRGIDCERKLAGRDVARGALEAAQVVFAACATSCLRSASTISEWPAGFTSW